MMIQRGLGALINYSSKQGPAAPTHVVGASGEVTPYVAPYIPEQVAADKFARVDAALVTPALREQVVAEARRVEEANLRLEPIPNGLHKSEAAADAGFFATYRTPILIGGALVAALLFFFPGRR